MRWTRGAMEPDAEHARPDGGLRVEVAPLGGRGSSGGLIVAAVLATALGAAILKPWAPTGDGRAAPVPASARPALAAASGSPPSAVPPSSSPDLARIESALRAVRIADWPRLAAGGDLGGQPIVTGRDLGGTHGDGTCGGSARVTPFDELLAVAAPPGQRIATVRLFAIDSIRRPDVPTLLQTDRPGPLDGRALDGLTLVGLPSGGIAARQYALIADTTSARGPGRLIYTICVG